MTSSLLLGLCSICGEPIFRHRRVDRRQITCAELARLDQEFAQSGAQPARQPDRQVQVISRLGHSEREGGAA